MATENKQFKLAGVMGMPVLQSRSPVIHNYWLKKYNILGAYGHFPVQIENIETAIRGLSALGLAGCNITQPHKLLAMELMDELDPMAKKIGAINCIVVKDDGTLHGFNNDCFGYIQSIKDAKGNWKANTGPIVVIGAGGASRAVLFGLVSEGATEIRLVNRSRNKAEDLANEFDGVVKVFDWDKRNSVLEGAAMLINTTNQGMYGQPELDIQLDGLPSNAIVSDIIYIPLETPLIQNAKKRGHVTVNGLGMLLNQAVPAFEAWFGVKPEITSELHSAILATF